MFFTVPLDCARAGTEFARGFSPMRLTMKQAGRTIPAMAMVSRRLRCYLVKGRAASRFFTFCLAKGSADSAAGAMILRVTGEENTSIVVVAT